MRKSTLAAAAAISMISLSSGALAQSAAPLSIAPSAAPLSLAAPASAGAATNEASDIRGGFILPTLALIVIGVLIYVLTKGNDTPASP
jgi:hypothetical protein